MRVAWIHFLAMTPALAGSKLSLVARELSDMVSRGFGPVSENADGFCDGATDMVENGRNDGQSIASSLVPVVSRGRRYPHALQNPMPLTL